MDIQIRPWLPEDTDMLMDWVAADRSILTSMNAPADADDFEIRRMVVMGTQDPAQQRFVALRDGNPVAALAVYGVTAQGVGFGSIVANPHDSSGFSTRAAARQTLAALFNGMGMSELHFNIAEGNAPALKLARLVDAEDLGVRQFRLTKERYEESGDGPGNSTSDR